MRIQLHELWDEMARWGIEGGFIPPKYVLEFIFHRSRFLFALGGKAGARNTESPEESFEYGCVFWIVDDFGEGLNPRISIAATNDEVPVRGSPAPITWTSTPALRSILARGFWGLVLNMLSRGERLTTMDLYNM